VRIFRQRTPDQITVLGTRIEPFRDLFHLILRAPWTAVLGGSACMYLIFNLAFAAAFDAFGGVGGVQTGSFSEYFYFSVQTMATIGYGQLYPISTAANVLVVSEAIVGMTIVALTTGLLFAKFSAVRARIQFASEAVIGPLDGIPTLMFRLGNERSSQIIDAVVRVIMYRTEISVEGVKNYRMYDVPLERERTPTLSRSWTVLHRIRPGSMLYGATPESLVRDEIEFLISMVGLDELTGQTMHARHSYDGAKLRWGARHHDLLSDREDGGIILDMTHFNDVVATEPTDNFPYPREAS